MVLITSELTTSWSTGYNGILTITNNTLTNYSSEWKLLCTLINNSSISWTDSLDIINTNSNQVTLYPRTYISLLSPNVTLKIAFGGTGVMPNTFKFIPLSKPTPPSTPANKPTPTPTRKINTQRRVVYLGYWLADADIPRIVSDLQSANITHALLTFIVHPDYTKSLTGTGAMLDAFKSLTIANQKLLTTSSFKIGISLGGALQMPVPYSNTFFSSNSYYYNNPQKYAQDYYNLVKGTGLENFFDFDIEHINDKFPECADFIGNACKELRRLNPNCEISHAPQPPYFCENFGNVYGLIYKNYKQYFSWFNIQLYNNGPCNTFEQIFIKSYPNFAPNTSILELINIGYDPSYLIAGKTVQSESDTSNGYVPLPEMSNIVKQAFQTPTLSQWSKTGGLMIWYFNTGNLNSDNNKQLLNYFSTVSQF